MEAGGRPRFVIGCAGSLCWVLGELVHLLSFRFFIYKMKKRGKDHLRLLETMKENLFSSQNTLPHDSAMTLNTHTHGPLTPSVLEPRPLSSVKSDYTWQGVLPDPMAS